MACTPTVPRPAPTLVTVAPPSLLAACAAVPDPRRHASSTDAVPARPALAGPAILVHHRTPLALAPRGGAVGRTPRQAPLPFSQGSDEERLWACGS